MVRFENQEEGEGIVLFLRPHVIILVPAIILTITFVFLPVILANVFGFLNLEFSFLSAGQKFLMFVFWYMLVFAYAFYKFIFWYFNVYILTTERVVDFDFRGILNKRIAYAMLDHIEDVSPKTIGFFGTLFNYGDVLIQTAAEAQEFKFEKVPHPDLVAERVIEGMKAEEGEQPKV